MWEQYEECESWIVTPGGMSPDFHGNIHESSFRTATSEWQRIDINGPKMLYDTHKYPLPLANVRNVLQGERGQEREAKLSPVFEGLPLPKRICLKG